MKRGMRSTNSSTPASAPSEGPGASRRGLARTCAASASKPRANGRSSLIAGGPPFADGHCEARRAKHAQPLHAVKRGRLAAELLPHTLRGLVGRLAQRNVLRSAEEAPHEPRPGEGILGGPLDHQRARQRTANAGAVDDQPQREDRDEAADLSRPVDIDERVEVGVAPGMLEEHLAEIARQRRSCRPHPGSEKSPRRAGRRPGGPADRPAESSSAPMPSRPAAALPVLRPAALSIFWRVGPPFLTPTCPTGTAKEWLRQKFVRCAVAAQRTARVCRRSRL